MSEVSQEKDKDIKVSFYALLFMYAELVEIVRILRNVVADNVELSDKQKELLANLRPEKEGLLQVHQICLMRFGDLYKIIMNQHNSEQSEHQEEQKQTTNEEQTS